MVQNSKTISKLRIYMESQREKLQKSKIGRVEWMDLTGHVSS